MGPSTPSRHHSHERRGFSPQRFINSFVSRPRPLHILLLAMFLLIGLAITTTVRTQAADPLAGLNEDQLVALLGDLEQREDALSNERSALQGQLTELKEAADASQAARDAVALATSQAEVAAGTVPVEGPGIIMRVSAQQEMIPVSVFVTTLAELRNAGAESISINDVRLNARAWFGTDSQGGIVASGAPLSPPYEWRAIGDGSTLSVALEIRGGAVSQFKAYGAMVTAEVSNLLQIKAVTEPFEPVWAKPAID